MIIVDLHQVLISNLMAQMSRVSFQKGTEPGIANIEMVRYMVCNSIKGYIRKFGNEYGKDLVLACDSGNPWRRDFFPQYKASRRTSREDSTNDWNALFSLIHDIKEELKDNFPYKVIAIDNAEADDIIGVIVKMQTEDKYLIVSGDKDFKQLQKYSNVSQYSPIQKHMVVEDNPTRYLHEQIIKGDRSDGIPNILSADDVFITKTKQSPITKKKLEEWSQIDDIPLGSETKKYYNRNKKLIDLDQTPNAMVESIINSLNNYEVPSRSKLLPYFIDNKLKSLIEHINDF
jgi:5'-3' exonuclease|tara:strand:+ start:99909 stop:100772 length:864 start_codon:yes stop_codon:yes gene_type:complete